ncbi:hypothetical protein J2T13_000749 [Paenibacillus sp. DS2015]
MLFLLLCNSNIEAYSRRFILVSIIIEHNHKEMQIISDMQLGENDYDAKRKKRTSATS